MIGCGRISGNHFDAIKNAPHSKLQAVCDIIEIRAKNAALENGLDKWYTDAEYTDKWINNPNYPDHDMYKSAVVDYAREDSQSTAWYYVNATDEFNATLDSAFSAVWSGDQTMKEAIDEYYEELNDIFTSNN